MEILRRRAAADRGLADDPFFLILMVYNRIGGTARGQSDTKLLPPISEMVDTTKRLATEHDRPAGDYVLWTDTAAAARLLLGLENFNPDRARA